MPVSVLIVDDNEDLLFLLSRQLQMEGFEVSTCRNGKNFASQLLQEMPDFVLLDISMGSVTGIELCEIVRKNQKTKTIRVILMSGNNDISELATACGADGFVRKPLDISEIRKKMEELQSGD